MSNQERVPNDYTTQFIVVVVFIILALLYCKIQIGIDNALGF